MHRFCTKITHYEGIIVFDFWFKMAFPPASEYNQALLQTQTMWKRESQPPGYKTFFMLNSTEHEISTAHKN